MNIRRSEIYRYMGYRTEKNSTGTGMNSEMKEEIDGVIDEVLEKLNKTANMKHCCREFSLRQESGRLIIGEGSEQMRVESRNLENNLRGCGRVLLFAATLGSGVDLTIRRYELTSMAEAMIAQAAGAEMIEAYVEEQVRLLEQEYRKRNIYLRPRFSPGYGDFNLEHQKDFFRLLDIEKLLGIRLTPSLLMVPIKSVTAVIGLTDRGEDCHISHCGSCDKKDCEFREETD